MARVDLAYARALCEAAPLGDLARALARRVLPRPVPAATPPTEAQVRAAADALGRAPRMFTAEPLQASYRALFPAAIGRLRARATRILDGEVALFGRAVTIGRVVDWRCDPLSGRRFSDEVRDPTRTGGDPKALWELARAGHLVELGAAARLCPELARPAREVVMAQLGAFVAQHPVPAGVQYLSPLEVALRGVSWLAVIELCGGARAFPRAFVEALGRALLTDAGFLATHLEDGGVCPANHLLGDLVGLYVLGHALDGAGATRAFRMQARAKLRREAARQVGRDGAHFEASTAYHRFALELLLVAHQVARASGDRLDVGETVRRMIGYTRGILAPDGSEPGFGDSDDARVLPIVPRAPADHGYLLSVGVALFADPALRSATVPFAEEALWLCGPAAWRTFRAVPPTPDAPSASFPTGGVHVARDRDVCVCLRAGSYGQHGVGGHAHNDQLAVVLHAGGRPIVVDAGTCAYTGDGVARDRFRGTAAHATVVVEGLEQSPILDGRPFALPDRARGRLLRRGDAGRAVELVAEHRGYARLPGKVVHRRRLVLDRVARALTIEDALEGRGEVGVEVRFPLGEDPVLLDARTVRLGAATLVVPPDNPLTLRLESAFVAPRYGVRRRVGLVALRGRLRLAAKLTIRILFQD